jgi:predicted MFS family arabinose efflux permease
MTRVSILGDDIDAALRPLIAVQFAGAVATSCFETFIGIWALRRLHSGETLLGVGFLLSAVSAAAFGYLGGHVSDHVGRRRVILAGWAASALAGVALVSVGDHVWAGILVMVVFTGVSSLGGAADTAMVADLVAPGRVERAYATMRVAANLGITFGPLVGALLLHWGWTPLFLGSSAMATVGLVLAYRFIPERGAFAPEAPPERRSWPVIRRDRIFHLFFVASCLSTMVYVAFEVLLPISLVQVHGLQPSTWGLLIVINPLLVALLQLRVTRAASRLPAVRRLVVGMLLMGLPFLLFSVVASALVAAVAIVVFVFGEMLWVPTSQAVVAELAPDDLRGAYMGAFGATFGVGFAIAPFLGLQVLHAFGDAAMWGMIAAIALLSATIYVVAADARASRDATAPATG